MEVTEGRKGAKEVHDSCCFVNLYCKYLDFLKCYLDKDAFTTTVCNLPVIFLLCELCLCDNELYVIINNKLIWTILSAAHFSIP